MRSKVDPVGIEPTSEIHTELFLYAVRDISHKSILSTPPLII